MEDRDFLSSVEPFPMSKDMPKENRSLVININTEEDFFRWLQLLSVKFVPCEKSRWLYRGQLKCLWDIHESNVREFVGFGDDTFFNPLFLPNRPETKLLQIEATLIRRCCSYNVNPMSKLQLLCEMQHCGIPTRLVDFTSNPLVALFMALGCERCSSYHAVWAYLISSSNEEESFDSYVLTQTRNFENIMERDIPGLLKNDLKDRMFVIRAPHETYRTAAQSAYFMTVGRMCDVFQELLITAVGALSIVGMLQGESIQNVDVDLLNSVKRIRFDFAPGLDEFIASFLATVGIVNDVLFPKCLSHTVFDVRTIMAGMKREV